MNNPLSDFNYDNFQLKTHNTEPNKVIDYLKDFIDSTQSNVSFQQKSSIFLNDERDNLKDYIEDMIIHYIYKRVFNDATMLYKEFQEKDVFIEKFMDNLDEKYVINLIDANIKLYEFSQYMYYLVQAPKKSDLRTWSKHLKNYAVENSGMNCYICVTETKV
jgi:alanine-alpha-ketoisovalerate/valine-pyruvate aminotransferase